MHNLTAHILFGTLTITVLTGFFIMIKNEIKIRRFSAILKKKLKEQNLRKLVLVPSKLPGKVTQLLKVPLLLPVSKSKKAYSSVRIQY